MALQSFAAAAPSPSFTACINFHCDERRGVTLDADAWARITALFRERDSAASERAGIRAAIALMEQRVGEQTGTWRDRARNIPGGGRHGQLDCIAESTNTTTYLRLFEQAGLLRWHSVGERIRRQRWLFMVHWTAVIREIDGGQRYAVDSWYGENGMPPLVQPLEQWLGGVEAPPPTPSISRY